MSRKLAINSANKIDRSQLRNHSDLDKWGAAEFLGMSVNTFRALTQEGRNVYVSGPTHDYIAVTDGKMPVKIWHLDTIIDHDREGGFTANQQSLLDSNMQPIKPRKHQVRETAQLDGKTVYLMPAIADICGVHTETFRRWIITENHDPILTPDGRIGKRIYYWTQEKQDEIHRRVTSAPYNRQDMCKSAGVSHPVWKSWVDTGKAPAPAITLGMSPRWDRDAYEWAKRMSAERAGNTSKESVRQPPDIEDQ